MRIVLILSFDYDIQSIEKDVSDRERNIHMLVCMWRKRCSGVEGEDFQSDIQKDIQAWRELGGKYLAKGLAPTLYFFSL